MTKIPHIAVHRGVEIHDQQGPERVKVVKRRIDAVIRLSDPVKLAVLAQDVSEPPEARLLAWQKVAAAFELASEARDNRPVGVNLDGVRASCAGLSEHEWRDPFNYASLLDTQPIGTPGPVAREQPLKD